MISLKRVMTLVKGVCTSAYGILIKGKSITKYYLAGLLRRTLNHISGDLDEGTGRETTTRHFRQLKLWRCENNECSRGNYPSANHYDNNKDDSFKVAKYSRLYVLLPMLFIASTRIYKKTNMALIQRSFYLLHAHAFCAIFRHKWYSILIISVLY